jgi:predicted transcriptional regulator
MADDRSDLTMLERRAARRLARLFRIGRSERGERRPIEAEWRLIRWRRQLLEELIRLDTRRRSLAAPLSPELDAAIDELAREVRQSQPHCRARIETLGGELRQRQGGGAATGLRDSADGRLLGRG